MIDTQELLAKFHGSRRVVAAHARWTADDPGATPDTCRYCGTYWRRWNGSKLDGHAACIVTDDFKHYVRDLLRSPRVTYAAIADAIGVTPSVVRSWTFPIRSVRRARARSL